MAEAPDEGSAWRNGGHSGTRPFGDAIPKEGVRSMHVTPTRSGHMHRPDPFYEICGIARLFPCYIKEGNRRTDYSI
jgi:hypothetical protein